MLKAKQTWTLEMVNNELINTTMLGVTPDQGVMTPWSGVTPNIVVFINSLLTISRVQVCLAFNI